jgi:hypothetical protein
LVVVSLVAGAAVGGIVGALLAVPMIAALVVLLERLQARDSPSCPSRQRLAVLRGQVKARCNPVIRSRVANGGSG